MPGLYEKDQIGQRESLSDLIANVEADATPFTSMLQKRKRPLQAIHDHQVKAYPVTGHKGVVDGKDADNFQSNPRVRVHTVAQKTWYNPAVSDFAEESVVAGVARKELSGQIADALVTVKRQIEKRSLSNEEAAIDDGVNQGYETRGGFKWVQDTAQSLYPVDAAFRTPTACIHTGTVANMTEAAFKVMARAAFKKRHGPSKLDGFVGVELKDQITKWTVYQDDVGSKTAIRTFNQDAKAKTLISVIDRLVLDTGVVDLHLSSFLWTDVSSGEDSAYTDKSGLFVDMAMWGLAYTRMPRVLKQEYKGGGHKRIVDAIFMLMCDNPLGHLAVKSNS